ncbi:MAG: type II toxin-antitoxin system RelE/ParE family toxin [Gammaproteobacteria bacterium]
MRQRIVVRPVAQLDFEEATAWYETQKKGLGRRFVDDFGNLLDRIATHPKQFTLVAWDIRRALMKRFPYAVYFATSEQLISIVAVLHQSRHPFFWKQHS